MMNHICHLSFQVSAKKLIFSDEKSGDQIKDDRFLFQIFAELFLFGSNFILFKMIIKFTLVYPFLIY